MDLTRRDTIKMLTGAAFVPALAFPASGANSTRADLVALRDRVQSILDGITQDELDDILVGRAQYPQIFKYTDMRVEPTRATTVQPVKVAHVRFNVQTGGLDERFIYQFTPSDCALGYRVNPSESDHEIRAFALALAKALKEHREIEAAKVLNTARTYDPAVGGDGCSLLSVWHPYDAGLWANTFGTTEATHTPLNAESLSEALRRIQTDMVDEAGSRVGSWGKTLVVPVALMDVAERAARAIDLNKFPRFEGYIVNDYLENENAWFVFTNINGLTWWEQEPFRLSVEIDNQDVAVVGAEKRCFGCHDPRAIFGSFPT